MPFPFLICLETTMNKSGKAKQIASDVRVAIEVGSNPVGFLDLDIDQLWPLINHRKKDTGPVEWMDTKRYDDVIRAAVILKLVGRLRTHLYEALGDEIVKAELDVESFAVKSETAAKVFGRTREDIEKLATESNRCPLDFYVFFWKYLLDDRDAIALRKAWESARDGPGEG